MVDDNTKIFVKLMSNKNLRLDSDFLKVLIETNEYGLENKDYENYESIPVLMMNMEECNILLKPYNGDYDLTSNEYYLIFRIFGFLSCKIMPEIVILMIYLYDPKAKESLNLYLDTQLSEFPEENNGQISYGKSLATRSEKLNSIFESIERILDSVLDLAEVFPKHLILYEDSLRKNYSEEFKLLVFLKLKYDNTFKFLARLFISKIDKLMLAQMCLLTDHFDFFQELIELLIGNDTNENNRIKLKLLPFFFFSNNINSMEYCVKNFVIKNSDIITILKHSNYPFLDLMNNNTNIRAVKLFYNTYIVNNTLIKELDNSFIFNTACKNCNKDYIEWMIDNNRFTERFIVKCNKNSFDFIEYVKKRTEEINKPAIINYESVFSAIETKDVKFFKYILDEDQDPIITKNLKNTLMMISLAMINDSLSIFKVIVTEFQFNQTDSSIIAYLQSILNNIDKKYPPHGLKFILDYFNFKSKLPYLIKDYKNKRLVDQLIRMILKSGINIIKSFFDDIDSSTRDILLYDYYHMYSCCEDNIFGFLLKRYSNNFFILLLLQSPIIAKRNQQGNKTKIMIDLLGDYLTQYILKYGVDLNTMEAIKIYYTIGNIPAMDLLYPIYGKYIQNHLEEWNESIGNPLVREIMIEWSEKIIREMTKK